MKFDDPSERRRFVVSVARNGVDPPFFPLFHGGDTTTAL